MRAGRNLRTTMMALAIAGSLAALPVPAFGKHGHGGGKDDDGGGEVSGKDGKDDGGGSSFDPSSGSGSDDGDGGGSGDSGGDSGDSGGSDHGGGSDDSGGGADDHGGSGKDGGGGDGGSGESDGDKGGHGSDDDAGSDDRGGHGKDDESGSDDHGGHGKDDDSGGDDHGGHGRDDDSGSDDHGGHGRDDAAEASSGDDTTTGSATADAGSDTGTDDEIVEIASDDPVEFDREGFATRGHELLALAVSLDDLEPLRELGLRVIEAEPLDGIGLSLARIEVPAGESAEAALAKLAAFDGKVAFGLNHLYGAGRIRGARAANAVRSVAHGKATVGMIDGRVLASALPGTVVEAQDFAGAAGASADHGTAVAALLAEAGAGRIYAANVFAGRAASADAIARALAWMASRKVSVINISLAGPANPIVERLLGILNARGHAIVAAIGNDGPAAPPLYPAAYPDVIAVTAVDAQDRIYRRANRGAWTAFAAPGVDVTVVDAQGAGRRVSGTSFAAPVVSVRLAELMPSPDPAGRRHALESLQHAARDLGNPGRDPVFGYGLITALAR